MPEQSFRRKSREERETRNSPATLNAAGPAGFSLRLWLRPSLSVFRDVAALFGQLGIFDDVIINAIFVIALHAGDDALDGFHAHARFDVVAEVVQQQNALLVITDLFLNVLNFTLQFVLTTVQTNKLQYVPKEGLVVSIFTPLIIEIRIRKATAL